MNAIVETREVHKVYRQGKVDVPAVRGISLEIKRGEFSALAGPSGSGKTTLLNLIGGLDSLSSGEIVLEGRAISEMNASEMTDLRLRRIGFVFQAFNLVPVLSALENVEYVMLLQGVETSERRERGEAVLQEVGLEEMMHRRPNELSGGQQQRVAIARAIVSEPALVLADEPTANLDSKTASGLLDMMLELNQSRGVTFLFSTHDQHVMDYARRLVLLKDGRVDEDRYR